MIHKLQTWCLVFGENDLFESLWAMESDNLVWFGWQSLSQTKRCRVRQFLVEEVCSSVRFYLYLLLVTKSNFHVGREIDEFDLWGVGDPYCTQNLPSPLYIEAHINANTCTDNWFDILIVLTSHSLNLWSCDVACCFYDGRRSFASFFFSSW
jgi:hypothetical protein